MSYANLLKGVEHELAIKPVKAATVQEEDRKWVVMRVLQAVEAALHSGRTLDFGPMFYLTGETVYQGLREAVFTGKDLPLSIRDTITAMVVQELNTGLNLILSDEVLEMKGGGALKAMEAQCAGTADHPGSGSTRWRAASKS